MSGQDERARQFKEAAEARPVGDQLVKEITTLRRFLYRNQEYRFTKSAQGNLYMAILAHHANPASLVPCSSGEPAVLGLLDDALKMPFTVFTSSQKDRLLQLYWSVLGEKGEGGKSVGPPAAAPRRRDLFLLDIEEGEGQGVGALSLMHDDGTEYAGRVVVADAGALSAMQSALESGASVIVTVAESADMAEIVFESFTVEDD